MATKLGLFGFFFASALAGCAVDSGESAGQTSQDYDTAPSLADLEAEAATEDLEASTEEEDVGTEAPETDVAPLTIADDQLAPQTTGTGARSIGSLLGHGTWAYSFTLVANGTKHTIASQNTTRKMYGASTFKLFTGWTAFETKSASNALISSMLRPSDNRKANAIMCQNGVKLLRYSVTCRAVSPAPAQMRMDSATRAAIDFVESEGVALSSSFHMVDGSGVSGRDTLTVSDLTSLLFHIEKDARGRTFRDLLAHPGVGTLGSRFAGLGHPLQAKTGTYGRTGGGVKALAGFVDLPRGTLVFAVVGNGVGNTSAAFSRIEQAVREGITQAAQAE